MKSEEIARKAMKPNRRSDKLKKWSKLQVRMTISYVGVSVVTALLVELLIGLLFFVVLARFPFADQGSVDTAKRTAQIYALEAAVQSGGTSLDPHSTFQPGQPSSIVLPGGDSSLTVPYTGTTSPTTQPVQFALLIAPNGQILASSYPALYPPSKPVAQLLSKQAPLILNALTGKEGSMVDITSQGHIASVAEPVIWGKNKKPIGAIYVQMPPVGFGGNILSFAAGWLGTALFWLILTAPVGAVFGVLTTRSLVRRIHRLVKATAQFANGDYTQRVAVTKQDEIGQLEGQFNTMAGQLVESIAQQKLLTEQQARLEERARIEQELHTAQLIQRSLLPKELPKIEGWQIATYYQPAREVGGDLYDFLTFEDGRLGLVIGDVADKGIPAALVMASTRSMLRAAAQVTEAPGEVLSQVNDLLYADTPAKMFVTCFYAVLDPCTGKLRYANAGQDLPYLRQSNSVTELRATGMPLGLMPESRYEEFEVTLTPEESILFYSDGLVEAHNPNREMFGFPRLMKLVGECIGSTKLIDALLYELATFTGSHWEQEDDVTMVVLHRTSLSAAET